MNRKEEMEALIEDCERYAKIIEGIQVAPDNWKDGDPTRREPRETLLKCAAALRASAAPEEGGPETVLNEIRDALETRGYFHMANGRDIGLLLDALPSDSGKAAPDALIEKIATEAERYASHYPQSSDGRNTFIMFADFVRALAPATEGGGREEIGGVLAEIAAERLGQISKGYDAAHDDEHTEGSIATAAAVYALHPFGWHFVISERVKGRSRSRLLSLRDFWPWEWDQFKPGSERQRLVKSAAMLVAEIERMDRLSPSPSVGTPAQTSARREGEA